MDDIHLPALPPLRPYFSRKRTRSDFALTTSSDPALFSSDDITPDAANYAAKRQRGQRTGTWWQSEDLPVRRKRSFRRNFDSGIFLGSEETVESLDQEFLNDYAKEEGSEPLRQSLKDKRNAPESELEMTARHGRFDLVVDIVKRCLERGQEDVDLS